MLKPWLSRTVQIVGTLALVALAVIVCRRTDWSKGFTPDGVMTLIAGVIAFVAVIIQIRSSSKQLREQVASYDRASLEERERRNRAVAKGILFEIDSFYRYYLRDLRDYLEKFDTVSGKLPFIKPNVPGLFGVFNGNTGEIGGLDEEALEAIVRFYSLAGSHWASLQRCATAIERVYRAENVEVEDDVARTILRLSKVALPELIRFTFLVSNKLCRFTGIKFEPPRVAVAGEKLSVEEIEASVKRGESKIGLA